MKNIPFISIGNDELKNQPLIVMEGTKILHQHENGEWESSKIKYGEKINKDGTKIKSNLLGFYTLKNGKCYLASVDGKLMNRKTLKLDVNPILNN